MPVKSISGAYGMAVLGLLLGIVGMHRYYLRRYLSATLMTVIFVAGLLTLTYEIIVKYYALLDEIVQLLSAQSANEYGEMTDLGSMLQTTGIPLELGYLACGIGGAWWFIDLFLLPGMVKQFNKERNT